MSLLEVTQDTFLNTAMVHPKSLPSWWNQSWNCTHDAVQSDTFATQMQSPSVSSDPLAHGMHLESASGTNLLATKATMSLYGPGFTTGHTKSTPVLPPLCCTSQERRCTLSYLIQENERKAARQLSKLSRQSNEITKSHRNTISVHKDWFFQLKKIPFLA